MFLIDQKVSYAETDVINLFFCLGEKVITLDS